MVMLAVASRCGGDADDGQPIDFGRAAGAALAVVGIR